MDVASYPQVVLGLDIGRINTRASLFGIVEGKYRFLGQAAAPTSLGAGRHLGEGVGDALERLQTATGRRILNEDGSLIQPATLTGDGSGPDLFSYGRRPKAAHDTFRLDG